MGLQNMVNGCIPLSAKFDRESKLINQCKSVQQKLDQMHHILTAMQENASDILSTRYLSPSPKASETNKNSLRVLQAQVEETFVNLTNEMKLEEIILNSILMENESVDTNIILPCESPEPEFSAQEQINGIKSENFPDLLYYQTDCETVVPSENVTSDYTGVDEVYELKINERLFSDDLEDHKTSVKDESTSTAYEIVVKQLKNALAPIKQEMKVREREAFKRSYGKEPEDSDVEQEIIEYEEKKTDAPKRFSFLTHKGDGDDNQRSLSKSHFSSVQPDFRSELNKVLSSMQKENLQSLPVGCSSVYEDTFQSESSSSDD